MYKKLPAILLLMAFLISCEEEPISTIRTAPEIGFAFYNEVKKIHIDSVITTDGKRIFTDSTARTYKLPLSVNDTIAEYHFYADTLYTNLFLKYRLELVNDVDRLNYIASHPMAAATNLDSLLIGCKDTLICNTNEAILYIYF